jgi:hypothetical protein
MNIYCTKNCANARGEDYKLGSLYKYYEGDIIDGLSVRYYSIYNAAGICVGYANYDFISENFSTVFEYNTAMREVDTLFDSWFLELI